MNNKSNIIKSILLSIVFFVYYALILVPVINSSYFLDDILFENSIASHYNLILVIVITFMSIIPHSIINIIKLNCKSEKIKNIPHLTSLLICIFLIFIIALAFDMKFDTFSYFFIFLKTTFALSFHQFILYTIMWRISFLDKSVSNIINIIIFILGLISLSFGILVTFVYY